MFTLNHTSTDDYFIFLHLQTVLFYTYEWLFIFLHLQMIILSFYSYQQISIFYTHTWWISTSSTFTDKSKHLFFKNKDKFLKDLFYISFLHLFSHSFYSFLSKVEIDLREIYLTIHFFIYHFLNWIHCQNVYWN